MRHRARVLECMLECMLECVTVLECMLSATSSVISDQ